MNELAADLERRAKEAEDMLVKMKLSAVQAVNEQVRADGSIAWVSLPVAFGAIYSMQEQAALPLSYIRFFIFAPIVREYMGKIASPLAWMGSWMGSWMGGQAAEKSLEVEEIPPPVAIGRRYYNTYVQEATKIANALHNDTLLALTQGGKGIADTALQACDSVKKINCDCRMTCNHQLSTFSWAGYPSCSKTDDALFRRDIVLRACGYSTTESLAITSFFRIASQSVHDTLVGPAQLVFVLVALTYVVAVATAFRRERRAAAAFVARRAVGLACLAFTVSYAFV